MFGEHPGIFREIFLYKRVLKMWSYH